MKLQRSYLFLVLAVLALTTLFAPFVFMKIGPLGYEYYGHDVPDIWIYGGDITGKDKSWWGIYFAYNFQRFFILLYAGLCVFSYSRIKKEKPVIIPVSINLSILLLFPVFMEGYIEGVIGNSDGADLTVSYQWGWVVYVLILALNVIALFLELRVISQGRRSS